MSKRCDNCRYFGRSGAHGDRPGAMPAGSACFRFPPVFYNYRTSEYAYETGFMPPRVSDGGWCGEWKASPVPVPAQVEARP